ncbi:YHYH protein, partial [Parvibaculum sp.]|uniref:YHYH protein n=1 Tax=Parvibaculum sp. TaxID=2024848 RepID=UPI0034A0964F
MNASRLLLALLTCAPAALPAFAHETADPDHAVPRLLPAAAERSRVDIREADGFRFISSNGLPDHATGAFPGPGNPNAIRAQDHAWRVALAPAKTGRETPLSGSLFGVALNGVPFDPGTAECWGAARGSRPNPACAWREEAIVGGAGRLGLDANHAHVQPDGTYHYHGVPTGLVAALPPGDMVLVGYAADGFPVYVSRSNVWRSGWRLKPGTRPSGPGGAYDGRYTQDFVYAGGAGTLDRCNGTEIGGSYAYVLTDAFPFVPRCFSGTPDASFRKGPPGGGPGGERRPPPFLR